MMHMTIITQNCSRESFENQQKTGKTISHNKPKKKMKKNGQFQLLFDANVHIFVRTAFPYGWLTIAPYIHIYIS